MKTKQNLILLTLLFISFQTCYGQKYRNGRMEFGLSFGAAHYFGDLAQEYVNPQSIGPMAGIFTRYSISPYFEWRNQASFAQFGADDANSEFYKTRNLNFETNIYEFASTIEFNFLPFGINKRNNELDFTPYAFIGLGGFYFDPKGTYNNETISLRDLRTENQDYSLFQMNIPLGMGAKLALHRRFEIGFEVGFRRLFTDYLDDVSTVYPNYNDLEQDRGLAAAQASHAHTYNNNIPAQPGSMRGDDHITDAYIYTNFTIAYRLVKRDPCP